MVGRTARRQAGGRAHRPLLRRARREPGRSFCLLLQGAACALALGAAGQAHAEQARPGVKGVYVLLGGGLEGHTGALAPLLTPGLSYGATLGFRPGGPVGVEMGYSGSLSDVREGTGPGGLLPGADVVRNGAQAVVTVGLLPTRVQPYVLGGLGVERFEVRGGAAQGLSSDTGGFVPAGAGLRLGLKGLLAADARVTYSVPLRQDFAPHAGRLGSGRYQVLLQVGGTY